MKKDIILAGVGGQGILSIAATIGMAALEENLFLKQSEVHGMSQRGGAVESHLRISSNEIASDLIPEGKGDLIISTEPMEGLRYLSMLSPDGWLITNTTPFVNVTNYPQIDDVLKRIRYIPNHVALDADSIAKKLGSTKSVNIVILGASAPYIGIDVKSLENAITKIFRTKGEDVINLNLDAFREGLNIAKGYTK